MNKIVVGIDPGLDGAIAVIVDGVLVDVVDMPVIETTSLGKAKFNGTDIVKRDAVTRKVNPQGLADYLRHWAPTPARSVHVYIEQVGARPDQGVSSAFSFGAGFGILLGVAAALSMVYTTTYPQTWKKAMSCTADKNLSRTRAQALFPAKAAMFARAKDDGRAEASLIAAYGYRQLYGVGV